MNTVSSSIPRVVAMCVLLALGFCATRASHGAPITITNTSDSQYTILDLHTGLTAHTVSGGYSVQTFDLLATNHLYEINPGQPGDQGSHFFRVNTSGEIDYVGITVGTTEYFRQPTPTSLFLGSVDLHIRQISGSPNTIMTAGGLYFPDKNISVGNDVVVNLIPLDVTSAPSRGTGFNGQWKNIFPFSFAQQTPVVLAPGDLVSMTAPGGTFGTIVPASLVSQSFVEGGQLYDGWSFTLANGSQWLYFTAVPEPSCAAVMLLAGGAALAVRRRRGV